MKPVVLRGRSKRDSSGLILPMVLVFALVVALRVGAAMHGSTLDARSAAWQLQAARARNFAETALDLLVRRTAERWPDGGVHCAADRYCRGDFPTLGALLSRAPAGWNVTVALVPATVAAPLRPGTADASSAVAYRSRSLEARVRVDGPVPVSLAVGLVLPLIASKEQSP